MLRSFLIQSVTVEDKTIDFQGVITDGVQSNSSAVFVLDNHLQRPDVQSTLEKLLVMPNSVFRHWRTDQGLDFEQALQQKVIGKIFLVDFRSPEKIEHIHKYVGIQDPYLGKISDLMKTYQIEAQDLQILCQNHFFVSSYKLLTPENKEDLLVLLQEDLQK